MGLFRKSESEKWAEAKKNAHEYRAKHGMKVHSRAKSYTPTQKIKDQQRIERER